LFLAFLGDFQDRVEDVRAIARHFFFCDWVVAESYAEQRIESRNAFADEPDDFAKHDPLDRL
jgi:hypothetical protein